MSKVLTRAALMKLLEKKFPKMWMKLGEEFSPSHEGHIWTGENSFDNEGNEMFDYYAEDYSEHMYVMGVRKTLHDLLDKHGWYAECHDPGTYILSQQ